MNSLKYEKHNNSPKKQVCALGVNSRRGNAVLNSNVTRLQRLRSRLDSDSVTLKVICSEFIASRSDEYAIFERHSPDGKVQRCASLVSKRGNVKYASNVRRRFGEIKKPFELMPENNNFVADGKTTVLFLTLTYDTKLCGFKTAWRNIGVEWNRFMSRVKKVYGGAWIVGRCSESFKNGYPHIHAILFFQESSFHTFERFSRKSKRDIWRIDTVDRDKIRSFWHSNIDIQGVENMLESMRYLEKYISKASNLALNDPDDKGLKTQGLSWVFGKRSFSVSRKFKEFVFERYLSLPSSDLNILTAIQTKLSIVSGFYILLVGD